jgi:hypothetical protein
MSKVLSKAALEIKIYGQGNWYFGRNEFRSTSNAMQE